MDAAGYAPTNPAGRAVHEAQVAPHEDLVLHTDPGRRSLWWAIRYVWSIRTNRILILASALGFFFFSGLRTFAVVLVHGRYGLGQGSTNLLILGLGVAAIAGALGGGRLADRLLARRHLSARPVVAGIGMLATAVLFVPGLASDRILLAVPLFVLAAAGLGSANPPLDAARLDLMPARLWGRAEAVRTVLRYGLGAIAPVTFGWVSTLLDNGSAAPDQGTNHLSPTAAAGLANTFMVMLVPLLLAGVLLILARRTYPRDVATAVQSDRSIDPEEVAAGARHAD
jgi:MFS family permease